MSVVDMSFTGKVIIGLSLKVPGWLHLSLETDFQMILLIYLETLINDLDPTYMNDAPRLMFQVLHTFSFLCAQ